MKFKKLKFRYLIWQWQWWKKELLQLTLFYVPMSQLRKILPIPTNFEEAYYHQNKLCRNRWRITIELELNNIKQLKVWHTVNKKDVPFNRCLIKSIWVFDIKRNGIFRAR
jgi:hypothetical protein